MKRPHCHRSRFGRPFLQYFRGSIEGSHFTFFIRRGMYRTLDPRLESISKKRRQTQSNNQKFEIASLYIQGVSTVHVIHHFNFQIHSIISQGPKHAMSKPIVAHTSCNLHSRHSFPCYFQSLNTPSTYTSQQKWLLLPQMTSSWSCWRRIWGTSLSRSGQWLVWSK